MPATTPIIQMKFENKFHRGTRHPLIMQLKTIYIQENKDRMKRFFVDEIYDWKAMHKQYPRSKYFSPQAHLMAEDIRDRFGYRPATSNTAILFHFKRLFHRLYPEFENLRLR